MRGQKTDFVWLILRLNPKSFEMITETSDPHAQSVPAWSAFNTLITKKPDAQTSLGYCPLLPASPTEYGTVLTVMKQLQDIMIQMGQNNSSLTLDEAIFSKAKEIQWKLHPDFSNITI